MESFFQPRKKRRIQQDTAPILPRNDGNDGNDDYNDDEPTELKLALLSSLHPSIEPETLLDILLAHDGFVPLAAEALERRSPTRKSAAARLGNQSSLRRFAVPMPPSTSTSASLSLAPPRNGPISVRRPIAKTTGGPKKGSTLHLYAPEDVAAHTPCSIVHNFLPAAMADELLVELLAESETFTRGTFKLFDNIVSSPHTAGFYVDSHDETKRQKTEYVYNGARLEDVRKITPQLARVRPLVRDAVNREIQHRIRTRYPNGKKLKHQSPHPWSPNAAFVNCYNGPRESVGWHSDQLTYLGPRAVIGSISLGVAREFRVRRVLPKEGEDDADAEGQISIHLPHNSLLVMHAEMQEEWKHCIAAAASVDPHPVAGVRRINVTYRDYRASMRPDLTPRCSCDVPCVLRVVQRRRQNYGRYFWMCHAGNVPDRDGCAFFRWAEFDDDGNPRVAVAVAAATADDG